MRETRDRLDLTAVNKNRVTVYTEDLIPPNSGLLVDDAATMFDIIITIIYNGANISYLKTYTSLRAANLQSTKNLVKMIAQHSGQKSVPIYYVSTISVGNIAVIALANNVNIADEISDIGVSSGVLNA